MLKKMIKMYTLFMAREIELKIPLSKNEYDDLYKIIYSEKQICTVKILSTPVFVKKYDEYYSKYKTREERKNNDEPQVIRIRGEESKNNKKSFFTLKRKSKENGIEFNDEKETYIENADVLRDLFCVAGYIKYFEKCKEAFGVMCCLNSNPNVEFHLELEKVNQFYYVEIECTKDDIEPARVGNLLESLVLELGLDPKTRDSRSWMKILES